MVRFLQTMIESWWSKSLRKFSCSVQLVSDTQVATKERVSNKATVPAAIMQKHLLGSTYLTLENASAIAFQATSWSTPFLKSSHCVIRDSVRSGGIWRLLILLPFSYPHFDPLGAFICGRLIRHKMLVVYSLCTEFMDEHGRVLEECSRVKLSLFQSSIEVGGFLD